MMGAHRVILSACSPYFHRLLSNPGLTSRHGGAVHPILMLQHDSITEQDLSDILAFVYTGRVNLPKARLPSFLAAAETLKIRGLVNSPKKGKLATALNFFETTSLANVKNKYATKTIYKMIQMKKHSLYELNRDQTFTVN